MEICHIPTHKDPTDNVFHRIALEPFLDVGLNKISSKGLSEWGLGVMDVRYRDVEY